MVTRVKGEEFRTTTVCIDRYENAVPVGRIYNRNLPEGKQFHSLTRFLQEMEQTLDDMNFPGSFTELRQFAPPVYTETGPPGTKIRQGAEATFVIRILFRQNASWQGSVIWLEGRQEQSFRSVLELVLLMDNALTYSNAS